MSKSQPMIPDGLIEVKRNGETTVILSDGVHYDSSIGEYFVQLDGEIVGYGRDEPTANRVYTTALSTRRAHFARSPQDRELYRTNDLETFTQEVLLPGLPGHIGPDDYIEF